MDALIFNPREFPLEKIVDFLGEHPPRLADIFISVCWLYKLKPDDMSNPAVQLPRDVFIFVATNWAVKSTERAQAYQAFSAVKRITHRLETDELLRDDLDLLAVRLTERVLERKNGVHQ